MQKESFKDFKDKHLVYAEFLQREESRYHHGYDEEMLQYRYIKEGDLKSIKESQRMFRSGINGKLSSNPLRHLKYLFVASTTLACRAAIEGGIEAQQAYNISDIFIQRVDACQSVEEVFELQTDMIRSFTEAVQEVQDNPLQYQNYSPEIEQVIDYIYLHLHEKILIPQLADIAHMSTNYLSKQFKKQTGKTIGEFILMKKIGAAQNMLLHTEYSVTEISAVLGFCSGTHFIESFKKGTGLTPSVYRAGRDSFIK